MKIFICFAVLSFVYIASAKNVENVSGNRKITGVQIISEFAATCSFDTFNKFAELSRKEKLKDKIFDSSLATLDQSGKQVKFKNLDATMRMTSDGKFEFSFNGQKFLGSDLCDLTLKMATLKNKSAGSTSFLFSQAYAADLITEDRLFEYVGIGGSVLGIGACAVSTAGWGLAACLALFGGAIGAESRIIHNKYEFERIINRPFKLFCDTESISLEGVGKRIYVRKNKNTQFTIELINMKSNEIEITDLGLSLSNTVARPFILNLAKQCNTAADAARIIKELDLKRTDMKTKMELALANYSNADGLKLDRPASK